MCCESRPYEPLRIIYARAAMCETCPAGRRGPRGGVALCTITGRDIAQHVDGSAACPKRRFPDANGLIRWLGIRWIGVPRPLRWLLSWRGLRRAHYGCGCIFFIRRVFGLSNNP